MLSFHEARSGAGHLHDLEVLETIFRGNSASEAAGRKNRHRGNFGTCCLVLVIFRRRSLAAVRYGALGYVDPFSQRAYS